MRFSFTHTHTDIYDYIEFKSMLYDAEQARPKDTAITEGRGYTKHWPHPPSNILKHKINFILLQ